MATKLTDSQKQEIIALLGQGIDKKTIALSVGVTAGQVAAVAAHCTMRTYEKNLLSAKPAEICVESQATLLNDQEPDALSAENSGGLIYIGKEIESGKATYWTPTPESGTTNPHLLIVGESGSGKTYTTQCICAEFARVGLPTIIFDFGQGFTLDSVPDEFIRYAHPVEMAAGRAGININPLQIFPTDIHGPLNVAQRVADSFARVYSGLGVQQHAVLRDAVLMTYRQAGIDPEQPGTWSLPAPRFSDLEASLDDLANNGPQHLRRYAATVASHISTVFVFNTFRATGLEIDWGAMLAGGGRTYILQLKGLEYKLERVVTELLLWNLLGYVESLGQGPLRCMVLLDEAHRLSFASNSPVEKMLREGRKFGLGLILASQQPEDFSAVAFSNTATKLILKVHDEKGVVLRQLAKKTSSSNAVSQLAKKMANLERGQGIYLGAFGLAVVQVESIGNRFGC